MRVLKYGLDIGITTVLALPGGAKILDVQAQFDTCQIWALCNEEVECTLRRFTTYGTGWDMPDNPGEYIGSVQFEGGRLVFHVFEESSNDV